MNFFTKLLLLLILSFGIHTGCHNPHSPGAIAISNLRDSSQNYDTYRSRADQIRNQNKLDYAINQMSGNRPEGCVQFNGRRITFGTFPTEYISRERATRELRGGATCRCIPMGTTCTAGSCLCSEICPADERILNSRAHQVHPSMENSFPFTNSTSYNDSVFAGTPLVNGYCTGFVEQRRRFSLLADFRPDLTSVPAMTIPSEEWKAFTRDQIRRLYLGENPTFIGLESINDLNRPGNEELKAYFMTLMGWRSWDQYAARSGIFSIDNPINGQQNVRATFSEPTARSFPGRVALDPATKQPIPPSGSDAYQTYIQGQIRKIMRGEPAAIPGYSNLRSIAQNPTYAELIGNEIAREWQESENTDKTWFAQSDKIAYRDRTRTGNKDRDMTSSEIGSVWTYMTENLPQFQFRQFPTDAEGNSWNQSGPIGSVSMSINLVERNPDRSVKRSFYHAVEGYAYMTLSNGSKRICIADPNNSFTQNNNCSNYIEIPLEGRPTYSNNPEWDLTTFDANVSSRAKLGQMITRNINYCRQINANNFAQNDCGE